MNEEIWSLEQVGEYLKVHPSTIYRMLRRKQLPAFKVGRDWKFHKSAVIQWTYDDEAKRSNGAQGSELRSESA